MKCVTAKRFIGWGRWARLALPPVTTAVNFICEAQGSQGGKGGCGLA
jgi:hypothetical protein